MKKIKGCLVKYNVPWYNGTIISPGAFKRCDGYKIPVYDSFDNVFNPDHIVGHADLKCESDGVYYECFLNDSYSANEVFKSISNNKDGYHIGLFANRILKIKGNVTDGDIRFAAFAPKTDGASSIDGITEE